MQKRKFASDSIFGIAASAIPIAALQLVIFPLLSKRVGENNFGFIITVVGIATIIGSTFGSSINNIRLVSNLEYEKEQVTGDFSIILWICRSIGFASSLICAFIFRNSFSIADIILFSIIPIINMSSLYYLTKFHLSLDYSKIFIISIIESAGYFSGYGLFILTGYWQLIYIFGYGFCLLFHVLLRNPLISEPIHTTRLFKKTSRHMFVLTVASLLASTLTYIDRLLLYPMLGGESVSVYYVATVIGKIIPLAAGPISGVMLSYFAKMSHLTKRSILMILALSGLAGIFGYFVCIIINPPLLTLLYPSVAGSALQYIHVTTLTSMVTMICSMLSPIVLKFYNINWQIKIHTINILLYLGLSLLLLNAFGLMGFCVGALITTVIRFVFMSAICLYRKDKA